MYSEAFIVQIAAVAIACETYRARLVVRRIDIGGKPVAAFDRYNIVLDPIWICPWGMPPRPGAVVYAKGCARSMSNDVSCQQVASAAIDANRRYVVGESSPLDAYPTGLTIGVDRPTNRRRPFIDIFISGWPEGPIGPVHKLVCASDHIVTDAAVQRISLLAHHLDGATIRRPLIGVADYVIFDDCVMYSVLRPP